MTTDVLTTAITAAAAVSTAVTALILNQRNYSALENRITALENRMDARFNSIQTDLKDRLLGDYDKRLQRIEDKQK